jgi:D-alanyl-D-alanine carboxypeptidase/D-alanyl-D-alanine-endopeptidase (penicillin-binding protein 4)
VEAVTKEGEVVWVVDSNDKVLLDLGGDKSFLPASTLKVFTVALAAEHLDLESHFETKFFLVDDRLVVEGSGDPYLVSEELDLIAAALKVRLGDQALSGVWIDDSAFADNIVIPGAGKSEKPYDALNSATAVNFNQINVKRVDGEFFSAEEQTPLTPLARERARAMGVTSEDRINISSDPIAVRRYAAELIAAKLRVAGVTDERERGLLSLPTRRLSTSMRTVATYEQCASNFSTGPTTTSRIKSFSRLVREFMGIRRRLRSPSGWRIRSLQSIPNLRV